MFKNLKLATKTTIFIVSVIVIVSVVYGISGNFLLNNLLKQEITDHATEKYLNFLADKAAEVQVISIASKTLDSDQMAIQLFLKKDREGLYQHLLPTFEALQREFNVTLLEFYLPDRTSFLRMQAKDSFGDKGAHDPFFNQINSLKQSSSGFGFEYNDLALRTIRSYSYQGKLVGYVEIGESVSHTINEFRNRTGDDFAVFLEKSTIAEGNISIIRSNPSFKDFIETPMHIELMNTGKNNIFKNCFNDEIEKNIEAKGSALINQQLKDGGRSYSCIALNITGVNGEHLGIILEVSDITSFMNTINSNYLIIGGLLIGFSIILFLIINSFVKDSITGPLLELNEISGEIAQGDLSKRIDIKRKDEIGQLSMSFNNMVDKLRQSYETLENKVKERTADLAKQAEQLKNRNKEAEDREQAILNILDDLDTEKNNLEQVNAKDEAFLKSIGEGVMVIDDNRKVLILNKMGEELLGWKEKNIAGLVINGLPLVDVEGRVVPLEKRPTYISTITGKIAIANDYFFVRNDKTKFPISITVAPIKIENKKFGAIVVFRDITKEREVDKAKTEFVSLASHQLRTPLSTIKWYVEMLLGEDAGKLNTEQEKYLKVVDQGNRRMIDLVNALLDVSRLEMGTFIVEPKSTDIVHLAKSVVEEQELAIKERKLVLKQVYAEDLPKINVDVNLLNMVFQNLLSNAIKYTPEKGKIIFTIKKKDDQMIIAIADTGFGIPKNQQDKIFTKLFRADNIRVKDTDGTGLGLYIAKAIIDHSNGKIWFESEENKGSTFYVSIPLAGMKKKEGTRTLS